jgi:subfamily B ATP-binding cassette protein MsbA
LSKSEASAPIAPGATHTLVARLFREHLRHHMGRLSVAMLCMAVAAAATAANAWLMEPVLDEVFVNRNEAMLFAVTSPCSPLP